ncbi:MAG TPA: SpoIIE family protein phosphatase [Vicinamibacterales bacterium]|nr:SpoIIE family protein phosphatase [Vicinamibacterales bacterium]
MPTPIETAVQGQLVERRRRVEAAMASAGTGTPAALQALLTEIDRALDRFEDGSFGLCEVCHDPIEPERLVNDPLVRFCLSHLTTAEQQALERDLDLAARIQTGLLPQIDVRHGPWRAARHYRPLGPVSGDYCDMVPAADGSVFFLLGDVSGKGVAASMLMVHLHAMFRTLVSIGMPLAAMLERASSLFCESTLAGQYATLICVRADPDGLVEIANAGHPPLLFVDRQGGVRQIDSTGLPLGMFCAEQFAVHQARLQPGEALLLYSDGLTEACNRDGEEFGLERLSTVVPRYAGEPVSVLVQQCLQALTDFVSGTPLQDDLTMMAIGREG